MEIQIWVFPTYQLISYYHETNSHDNIIIFQIFYISILENEGLIWPIKRKCHQLVFSTILFVDETIEVKWKQRKWFASKNLEDNSQ